MTFSGKRVTFLLGGSLLAGGIGWMALASDRVDIRAVESSAVVMVAEGRSPTVFNVSEAVDEVKWGTGTQTLTILTKSEASRSKQRRLLTFSPATKFQSTLLRTQKVAMGLAVSQDGKTAFLGQWRTGQGGVSQILMFDSLAGVEAGRLDGAPLEGMGVTFTSDPLTIAVSPDSRFIAAGTKLVDKSVLLGGHIGGEVCLWRIADKSLLWTHRQTHTDIVECVAFSPDSKTLASAGDDKLIRLWDTETGELRQTLVGACWNGIASVAWSPDGSTLATCGMGEEDGGSVRVWDLAAGKMSHRFQAFRPHSPVKVAFSPNGRLYATGMKKDAEGSQFRVHAWDTKSGKHIGMLAEGIGAARAIDVSSDGSQLAIGTFEGNIVLLELTLETNP